MDEISDVIGKLSVTGCGILMTLEMTVDVTVAAPEYVQMGNEQLNVELEDADWAGTELVVAVDEDEADSVGVDQDSLTCFNLLFGGS